VSELTIGTRAVGTGHPTYFVADIAANHDGDLDRAVELIHLAADAGADAAKFQNFRADTIVSGPGFSNLSALAHQAKWSRSVVEVYRSAEVPLEWSEALKRACDDAEIDYFTTPYDLSMIPELSPYVAAWKIGSGDITWFEEIDVIAGDRKPVLLATGASTGAEVTAAVNRILRQTSDLVLMQCNTDYTGSTEAFRYIELRVLATYAKEFPDVVLGLSDHTPGHATVLGAVAFGASVVEKHFTDDPGRDGPDHPFSMSPATWRDMVDRTRELELALGTGEKRVMPNESETVVVQRRSLRATRDLAAGTVLAADDLIPLRPCPVDALPPYRIGELVGRPLERAIERGACVTLDDVADTPRR
jgi:N-acetylneuraminate synthase